MLHHPEYRERYAANLKRELPRIPFVGGTAGPSAPAEAVGRDDTSKEGAGSARDDNSIGRAGLQASVQAASQNLSTLPKARAEPTAERHKETAGLSARDDKFLEDAGRGAEAPLYPNAAATGSARDDNPRDDRGPSTPLRSAQDDTLEINAGAPPLSPSFGDRVGLDKSVFWRFVEAGRQLAELHVNYEQQLEYPLERAEKGQLNWRVEKMRLSKDKTSLVYNDFLTLKGIPLETYEYRLGNRSALEWVIDQYQLSTDKRSGIVNDPNRADDPEYIVRLIGQVITVSLETMKIVKALPPLAVQ